MDLVEQLENASVGIDTVEKKERKPILPGRGKKKDSPEVEEKREQLSILAVLGTIESYTGVNMSLGDVKKLSSKDVEKYHNRYQVTMGSQVTGGLIDIALQASTELLSNVLPIDDKEELCTDLKKNELVKQELNNVAGYVVLHGGRFVALGSGLLQVVKHIQFSVEHPSTAAEQS